MENSPIASFQFGLPGSVDELGVWQALPVRPKSAARSFGLPGTPANDAAQQVNYFVVELPGSPGLANEVLSNRSAALQRAQSGMNQAGWRLKNYVTSGAVESAASFALPGSREAQLLRPELEISRWTKNTTGGAASFGSIGGLPSDWKEVSASTSTFIDKVQRLLDFSDLIESRLGGERLGLSRLEFSGNITTAWSPDTSLQQVSLHEKVVRQAIQTRSSLINLGFLVVRGGILLAGLFTNPVMALPAAYKFFRQVLEQVQNMPRSQ